MSYLSKYDEATVGHFFPSFLSVYKKLIYHPNYNLRESLNMSLKIFIEKIKTKIKKHINVFLPPLFLSFFDYSKNVKQVSNDILSLLFPLKEDLDRGEEKSSEEKKKEKGNAGKIKLYNDNKLYLNVKKLNINITNFYNCLIYIKNDLDEEALGYIKNRENSDDYHKSVYLFNVLCFYPSLLYMIIKFCKMNILEECKNDLNNMEDKLINNNMNGSIEYNHYYNNNDKWNLKNDIYLSKVRDIFKIQYNNFSNTYNSFFLNINIIYKENKDDVRLQKMLYLCVYNIIYLLKKIKINFMTLNNENVNESLCNYICSIINNKEEYIYKTINHLLLLLFFMDNRKIIKENFLKSYLSLVKQNKIYSNDVFNYNICLFLFLFKKEDIEEYFFFFFFLFYFLLLNNNKSCIVIYYDILLHLYDYFSFISIQQIQKNEKEGTNTIIKKDNINNKLYVDEKYCSYVLCLHILLLPLEMILIQKKLLDCNYSYKNKDLYENLINRYYCNKKKINPKKDVKEKDKFDDLRKKIKDTNIDEKHFLLTFINFINSSKNKNDIIFSSLDLISVYVNNMYDELNKRNQNDILKNHICNDDKNDKILKDENNKNNYNESYNITNKKNRSQSEYVEYYEVLHFLFQLFSEIKNVLFSTDLSCHENVIIITRNKYISTLKIIFINTFMLIKNNHYKLINIVKNNMLLFKFFFSHTKEEPPSPSSLILSPLSSSFSLIIIFDIINKILSDNNINKDIYFDSLNVGLNVLYMFFVMYNQSTYYVELAKMFFSIVLCEPVDEDKAEEKFKVCIDVLQFMRRENIKFLDLSYEILRIYYHYIMNKCKDEDLLKTFYELIYEDEKTNRNKFLFDRQFYIDLFYVHKEKMYLTQSLPDITFCSFFCKLVLENLITYDCRDDTTNKNNLYVYFLLLTLLRVDFNYDEKLVQLFMTLDKKILLRYMEVLRSIYKNCRDDESATYGNGRIEKNILHSIMDDPYDDNTYDDNTCDDNTYDDNTYDDNTYDDNTYDDNTYDDNTYDDNTYDNNTYDNNTYDNNYCDDNGRRTKEEGGYLFLLEIYKSYIYCGINYEMDNMEKKNLKREDNINNIKNDCDNVEEEENDFCVASNNKDENINNMNNILNKKEEKKIEQYVFIKRKNILSSSFINRLLFLYKLYYDIYKGLDFTHVIHCTYYFCLDVVEPNDIKITEELWSPSENYIKLEDSFFDYIYANMKSKKLYKFLKNVYIKEKDINQMDNYKKYDNLNLYFIIYKYMKKNRMLTCVRKKLISDIMKRTNKNNITFVNIIYVMKNIQDNKIFKICKALLKYMYDKNYIFLDEILYYLKDIKVKNNVYFKLKIFLYKEFIIKKVLMLKNVQYNKDNEDNDDEKINETPNLMLYNNNNSCPYIKILEMIKKYVPDYLHFYIDNNFKLNVKNEIQYLNLFHHLIYISKYTSFNLYIYKSVQKALYESLQIISLSNYDIIFYSLEFVLRSPNYFSFFIENNMVTVNKENIFLNYSFYLKTYYKKIYDKYISVYKNKRIVLNNILSNTYNVQKNCIEHNNNKENIIKISQKNQKRNKIKNKQLYEYNKGVHFLRFMYELLEQHREVILFRNLVESKTFIQTLIKIIYFILSIYSCRKNNNMINERYKDICIKILGHMLKHEEKYKNQDNININGTKKINRSNNNYNNSSSCCFPIIVDQDNNSQTHLHAIYKIYLLSLKFCVTEYFEYFEGMNIFFNNVKNIHFDSIKKHEEKKILDIYINTYYLYILFSNMEKFKENKIFIDKTFSLLFLNCLFIKRLHDLKNEGNPIFQEINKYLCINNDTHNEFLYFIIEENMKRGEKNVEQKNNTMDNNNNDENNGHSGDEKSGHHNDDQKSGHHNDDQKSDDQKSGHHNDDQKSVHSDDEIIGDNNFLEDNQSNINEENNKIFKIEGKENDYTYDKLNNIYVEEVEHMSDSSLNLTDDDIVSNFLCFEKIKKKKMNDLKKKKKSNENGRYQVNNTCLDKNIKHENNSNNIYNIDNDNIKNRYDNKTCTNNIKTKKNKSLYFLKKSLKNPFLLIDINKNILDLYSFLLEMNYLKILLSMLNICLSSEYFIYDSDTYQQFLLFIESNNFNIFHFFKDIKEIDCCLIQKNDSLKNAKKTKVYIFFFSLYLTLLLITTYPNESIIIINQNKLYNIITFNQIIFSNLIINYQLNQLKIISTQYVNTTYSYDPLSKILSFKYKIKEDENEQFEDMTAKLTLTFLPNYPFSHFIISDKIESLDKKAYIHNSIKSMYKYARNGDINEIFIKFDNIMNNYFENKAQCNICFMLLYDKKTCDKNCLKCKASYHSHCLHKWFLTSHNTKCPSCQMQFC
ncbi:hypothetical protein PFUGPA_04818 [Plasmodium falciparum Palo Alto/Uganda]|uniref:E3 ubiquitin-protein ligase listerin n=1 Tax=Plasmodium falciparum (isolate Palo Alto / Uganda) TaxID=57270 RepID=W4ISW5_PLAFP|nr:hypothetical protein PFUGPA_04818 [Plasmodium falciparum Palo Alto/Uganda]